MLTDGTNSYLYGPDGLPIEQIEASASFWFVHDQVGNTLQLLDNTGATAGSYTYTPYGVPTQTGTATTPLLYTGQYTDSESGLVYLRARYYDPGTAEFLTVDPQVDSTRSAYGYVQGNPLDLTDPSGMCWSWASWACSAAHFVWDHRTAFEIGLGVASLAIPVVGEFVGGTLLADTAIGAVVTTTASAIGNGLFYADTALSIADARYTCQTGGVAGCAVSVASIGAGVAGYGFAAGAKAVSKLSEGEGSAVGRWAGRHRGA